MIGSTGFRGINDKGDSTFLADFESIAFKGKTDDGEQVGRAVWLILDSNITTNPQVLGSGPPGLPEPVHRVNSSGM